MNQQRREGTLGGDTLMERVVITHIQRKIETEVVV
jgi:hypothetical protein